MVFVRQLKKKEMDEWYISKRSGECTTREEQAAYIKPGLYKIGTMFYVIKHVGPHGLRKYGVLLK